MDVSALSEMKGDGSAADLLMPKLLELQNKVAQMESKNLLWYKNLGRQAGRLKRRQTSR